MTSDEANNRTSHILALLVSKAQGTGDISVSDMLRLLGERAFGLAILIFSLPNSLPLPSPPGFSAVTGIPIMLLALQMMIGKKAPWLPKRVGDYRIPCEKFASFMTKAIPYIRKVERLLHPRLRFMQSGAAERVIGLVCLLLSIVLSLPIPFANFVPGLAITVIALGLLERDGAIMIAGMLLGIGGVAFIFIAFGAVAMAAFTALFSFF